jgi:dUTP pyrophosphatase
MTVLEKITVKVKRSDRARVPEYQSSGSSGADILACLAERVGIEPGQVALIPTGIAIEIPEGYEAQIRPRSGLALKSGITILNSPGTIDSDYRGEIKIIVANLGSETFLVENGMRIAQMIFSRIYRGDFIEIDELEKTDRNAGGFGHTGV